MKQHGYERNYRTKGNAVQAQQPSRYFAPQHPPLSLLSTDFSLKFHTRVYTKVSGLAAWSENCKWYSSLPVGAVLCR